MDNFAKLIEQKLAMPKTYHSLEDMVTTQYNLVKLKETKSLTYSVADWAVYRRDIAINGGQHISLKEVF